MVIVHIVETMQIIGMKPWTTEEYCTKSFNKLSEGKFELQSEYNGDSIPIKVKHIKCNSIFEVKPGAFKSKDWRFKREQDICPCCYEYGSQNELELLHFVQNYYPNARKSPRGEILPLELDIYIPDLKIGFEYNGNYWHSSSNGIKQMYHKNKSNMFLQKGINVIHLWEYWGLDMCKSIIQAKLGLTNKLQARKCKIQPIDSKLARLFLKENHFHGYKPSKICLGLFFDNELVSCITFTNTDLGWELSRFACRKDVTVIGGFAKLLDYFWRAYQINEIHTYAYKDLNADYTKSIYYKNEFEFVHETGPSLYYWDSKSNAIIMRRNLQKKKIKEKYPEVFDESKTEKQMCEELGFYQIYDSGTYKFKKKNPYL